MNRNEYRRAFIMLRPALQGYGGHARLERRTLTASLYFIVSAPQDAGTLTAALAGQRDGTYYAAGIGQLSRDRRGQLTLAYSFDPRAIDGRPLEAYAWVVVARADGAVALTGGKESKLSNRILCLILGAVTLFLVATAVAKMVMYIDSYGLTRLRVLTTVVMVFLAVTTVVVSLWLMVPKIPYMKWIVIAGLLIGAVTAWADVDTVVAAYNVRAYQAGQLQTVDINHLCSLSDGAVPYI